MVGQVAASRGDIEVARNLWLQPCANPELGAALYSNVAFAALKCGGSRTVDHVCLAAVVGVAPRNVHCCMEPRLLLLCVCMGPFNTCVLGTEAARPSTIPAFALTCQPSRSWLRASAVRICQLPPDTSSADRPRCARCGRR